MAKKKKENTLSYLQMPLPSGGKYSKMTKVSFGGLNKRYTHDSGNLSIASNISTNEYPYLVPSSKKDVMSFRNYIKDNYEVPMCLFGFDDYLIAIYRVYISGFDNENYRDMLSYINADGDVFEVELNTLGNLFGDYKQRSVVQFNVYDTPTDPISGKYIKRLLIFPDKKSITTRFEKSETNPLEWEQDILDNADVETIYRFDNNYYSIRIVDGEKEVKSLGSNRISANSMSVLIKEYDNGTSPYLPPDTASHNYYYKNKNKAAKEADTLYGSAIYKWVDDESNPENSGWKISIPPTMPDIKYATVHLSRVFGVDDDRVYASGFNDYTNWNLDTIDEYNDSNAWCSPSQSNTKAGGNFTGITTYQNHVICFKQEFMHEIYNTKNPFRIQDIYAEGAIDNRTIQDVDGKLIFVSADGVKIYTGSNPRIIDYPLNMTKYTYAVSGTDNRNYYLYCEDAEENKYLYVYDTFTDLWSEQSIECKVINFAHNKNGMYMLCDDGYIYKMDTNNYAHNWSFETDLITNKTVDIKHIKKLQMLVDVAENANIKTYILYDDEEFDKNTSHLVYSSNGKQGKFPIRVKPRKTANYGFKLHFEGTGYVKLYELEMFIEAGGDMYV